MLLLDVSWAEWINASASITGVFVTIILAIIAIWSDDIKSQLRRPNLHIYLKNPEGEWTLLGKPPKFPAIYFHVVVENETPSMIANQVELIIKSCRIKRYGKFETLPLPGPLPIKPRRNHESVDIGWKNYTYDIFRCKSTTKKVEALVINRPNNFPCWINAGEEVEIEVQAQGLNAASNTLKIQIKWSGTFPGKIQDLGKDLTINITNFPAPEGTGVCNFIRGVGRNISRR
jgi:hypothetical protein